MDDISYLLLAIKLQKMVLFKQIWLSPPGIQMPTKEENMKNVNRRDFLNRSALALGALVGAPVIAKNAAANERVTMAIIGCGRMGQANLQYQKDTNQVDIAAVCDVFESNLKKALGLTDGKAKPYKDFRRILERKDIDAVVISTPDHWHALQTILSCEAGKDVFVEKPLAVTIDEGRKMVEAARRTKRVVQMGTMQRSARNFQRAVEIVQSGILGKIGFVRTWNFSNEYPAGIGNPPDGNPPPGLDWDQWLGPAPYRPFNANRFGVAEDRWSSFRWFWDYAGGMMTDWGVHLIDIVLWAMQNESPKYISAAGGKYFLEDNRETPDTLEVTYAFDSWMLTYTNQCCNARGFDGRNYGIQFYGSDATLFVDRSGYELFPETESQNGEIREKTLSLRSVSRSSGNQEHAENFIRCIKTREKPVCDVEIGHRSTTVPHLGNIALRTGARLEWDFQSEKIVNAPEANAYLRREYRAPWNLI